jgi:hypothetical protein
MLGGPLGLVLELDEATEAEARALTRHPDIADAAYHGTTPHVSLYHAPLKGLTELRADQILREASQVVGLPITFSRVGTYGGRFLFWDAVVSAELFAAHNAALVLARYVDRTVHSLSDGEGLVLTPAEQKSVEMYAYPFVKENFRPHITLAYSTTGFEGLGLVGARPWCGQIRRACIAEMGLYGAIRRVLLSM